jgi:hypothetical protein
MQRKSIPIDLLQSPKSELDFAKRSIVDFYKYVAEIKSSPSSMEPISVYPLSSGKFYISDGVHRAKAAQLAGLDYVEAFVFTDSKPMGASFPLTEVHIPIVRK